MGCECRDGASARDVALCNFRIWVSLIMRQECSISIIFDWITITRECSSRRNTDYCVRRKIVRAINTIMTQAQE